jgi:hypothetical protein
MLHSKGPIYESTFYVDADLAEEFDAWLAAHCERVEDSRLVVACRSFPIANDDAGRIGRACQYTLTDDDAVGPFLDGPGTDVEAEAETRFDVLFSSRLLREDHRHDTAPGENPDCMNCGTRLRGQYCGTCGQKARGRMISLWELVSDAFGDIFELDSRLWRTLVPLLFRPGKLTADYLAGRRARFMPPFRTYLVLSLLFFVVAFFDPRTDFAFLFEPAAEAELEEQEATERDKAQEVLDELEKSGVIAGQKLPPDALEELAAANVKLGALNVKINRDDSDEDDAHEDDCTVDSEDLASLPSWFKKRLTQERIQRVCERIQAPEGENALLENMLDNVPVALIILLPIMGLVLLLLYPLSRHYYVEHLLFFVHFHAFFFLLLTIQILLARLGAAVTALETPMDIAVVAGSLYLPVYLFMAMRRVYGQGRFVTFLKYIALSVAYFFGFGLTMLGALAIAAFSV